MNVSKIELSNEVDIAVRKYIEDDNWEVIHKRDLPDIEGGSYQFRIDEGATIHVGEYETMVLLLVGVRKYHTIIETPHGLYHYVKKAIKDREEGKSQWVQAKIASYLNHIRSWQ